MKTITLNVSDELASKFERLTEKEKQLAIETLARLLNDKRTLFEVMDDISEYAKKQGLNKDTLKDLLKGE
jgi:hypothetical protein